MENNLYGTFYAFLALGGGINGLLVSKEWGGLKSVLGKAIIFLSLGLLGEAFGQFTWSYYNIIRNIEVPYPSIADLGYFSIIPFYSMAMLLIAKASGATLSLKNLADKRQILAVPAIPAITLTFSYLLFLKGYQFDFTEPMRIFLDLGYPLGEAVILAVAVLTFILSNKFLGGSMKPKIRFIIIAFIIQYVTDVVFLYRSYHELYYNGGVTDLMYATSFLVMSIGILQFKTDLVKERGNGKGA